ncbi:MAG: hypothetical protein ACE5LB_11645 [Acidiferrobacterales bacterium]
MVGTRNYEVMMAQACRFLFLIVGLLGLSYAPAQDRLDLEGASIIGNRELPKVLYIVPWKAPNLDDLPEPPPTGLLDETLGPVDREAFRRQIDYYGFIERGAHADKEH